MRKISQYVVSKNWEEYSAQGPEFAELADWWKTNYHQLPNVWSDSYSEWTKWYKERQAKDWAGQHKGPKEVLSILKTFINNPEWKLDRDTSKRWFRMDALKKMWNDLWENKQQAKPIATPEIPTEIPAALSGPSRVGVANQGVDITHVSDDIKMFLDVLGKTAQEMKKEMPVVSSGFRTASAQARSMARNWNKHGGPENGLKYLIDLYSDDEMAKNIHNLFLKYGTDKDGLEIVSNYLSTQKPQASSHMKNPAEAVDLRITQDISLLLKEVENKNLFNMRIIDEGDHLHVRIYGIKSKIANSYK